MLDLILPIDLSNNLINLVVQDFFDESLTPGIDIHSADGAMVLLKNFIDFLF